ncbi:hypothetical protein HK405_008983 [Cladochytrium tenue]|nr:hypothetical protein HK405_008983 [Cladochytrium tenue]
MAAEHQIHQKDTISEQKEEVEPATFAWDLGAPDTPFWSDFKFTTGRNFVACFTQDELQRMPQLSCTLENLSSHADRAQFLDHQLRQKQAALERLHAPAPLSQADYPSFQSLAVARVSALEEMQDWLGMESTLIELRDAVPGKPNLSAINMLGRLWESQGKYAEAETSLRQVLAAFEARADVLGPCAPPTMGSRRGLICAVWRQGRVEEAEALVGRARELIEQMGETKFRKYQAEEREMLEETVRALREDRPAVDGH